MKNRSTYKILTYLIASVWLINGLFCKILNLVPKHEAIVARILGSEFSRPLIILIGISEIFMVLWILSDFKKKINAVTQISIVATMNIIEFIVAPDLLLWGHLNIFFAFLFILAIYYKEFILNIRLQKT